jgi:hypothetical protein
VRKEIANRLLAGDSAVWVVGESGEKTKDDAAVIRLEKKLAQMERELKLPDKQALAADEHYKPQTKVDLKIAFSVVRIPVQHDDETIFVSTLLKSDPDVRVDRQPLAIAVFGQGRSYFPLVGDGIDAGAVDEHCRFLTGDCSCEVKEANPGIDLLFAVPWNESITRTSGTEQEAPELSGIGVLAAATATSPAPAELAEAEATTAPAKKEPATPASSNMTAAAPAADTPAALATQAPSSPLSLTWVLGPAAIGLVVVLLGTLWFRMGR